MMGSKSGVTKHSIPLMPGDIAFIEADKGMAKEEFYNKPMVFKCKPGPSIYVFETLTKPLDEIAFDNPIISGIVPARLKEYTIFDLDLSDKPQQSERSKTLYDLSRSSITSIEESDFDAKAIVVIAQNADGAVTYIPQEFDAINMYYTLSKVKKELL